MKAKVQSTKYKEGPHATLSRAIERVAATVASFIAALRACEHRTLQAVPNQSSRQKQRSVTSSPMKKN